jgi:hypothetical protein
MVRIVEDIGARFLADLLRHPNRWVTSPIKDSSGQEPLIARSGNVRWFPITQVASGTHLGFSTDGEWVLGPRCDSGSEGALLFTVESKPFLYLTPMLDRLPRLVMNDVRFACDELDFTLAWSFFPWRFAIHSGIVSGRIQYIQPAVDWAVYLGVLEDFRPALVERLGMPKLADNARTFIAQVLDRPAAVLPWPSDC